jgi:hypothetical protein
VSAEKFTGRLSALDERNRERPPETDMPYVELFENRRIGLSFGNKFGHYFAKQPIELHN